MKLIFMGPPGAGKGTLATGVTTEFDIIQISTGDMMRSAAKQGTIFGLKATSYMDGGDLVPDDLVLGMLQDRIKEPDCAKGYILDGFPRTIPQAQALENSGVEIDRAVNIQINDELIVYRLSARRIHRDTGQIFSINPDGTPQPPASMPPEELIQRADDWPEAIQHRLDVYRGRTQPLIAFYQERNMLLNLDGTKDVEPLVDEIKVDLGY